jgi:hypothetical protein
MDGVLRTAAEVMLTTPARHPLSATVGEIRDFFRDDHVHALYSSARPGTWRLYEF